MMTKHLLPYLMLAILSFNSSAITLAQQVKVIKYSQAECKPDQAYSNKKSGAVYIYLNDQNILIETSDGDYSFLLTDEGYITIGHKKKVYSVLSYDTFAAIIRQHVKEGDAWHERTGKWLSNHEVRWTDEADIISGVKVRKVIDMWGEKYAGEFWVTSELIPMNLRERLKSIYPEDYWKKVSLKPWLLDIITQFGVPLRGGAEGHQICEVQILEESSAGKSFQVPSGYRKIEKVN